MIQRRSPGWLPAGASPQCRQGHREFGASIGVVAHAELAAMLLDDAVADGKPQPVPSNATTAKMNRI
jgi:hypothetical protein